MAIAHDATTPAVNSANSTGESFAHTCTGSDLTLVAIVLLFGVASNGVSAITYNGVSMGTAKVSREYNYTINRYLTALIFTLDGPAAGSSTFAVTFNGTAAANAIILTSYTGANNGVGANTGGADGTDDTPTASFDTDASSGLIVAGATVLGADTDPFTPGADVTERSDGDTGGGSANTDIGFATGDKAATGGTDTIAFTAAAADFWTIVAIELNEAAGGGVTLVINDASHGHAADNVALTQHHTLIVSDAAHNHSVETVNLTQHHVLAVDEANHSHTAETVDLTQHYTLVVADASHAHTADEVTLTIGGSLAIHDATHNHSAETVNLAQHHVLAVDEANHSHTAETVDLAQNYTLVVADASHAHSADVVTLTLTEAGVLREVALDGLFALDVALQGQFNDEMALVGLFADTISLQGEL